MNRKIVAVWVCAMVLASAFVIVGDIGDVAEAKAMPDNVAMYTAHTPIRINSNADFIPANGVSGGDGTLGNPWIIENWAINGSGYGYCIYIGNVTQYFKVKNCSFSYATTWINPTWESGSGIILYYVNTVAHFTNVKSTGNYYGIKLYQSDYNTIANSNFSGNSYYGILLDYSDHNLISNNQISNCWCGVYVHVGKYNQAINNNIFCQWQGIYLYDSQYNYASDNRFTGSGISFSGNLLQYYSTHTIDTLNTVNGRTLYYLKNTQNLTVPPNAGQVIIVNCENIVVDNQNLSSSGTALLAVFSTNVTAQHIYASDTISGGLLFNHCDYILINNCSIDRSRESIRLNSCDYFTVDNCTITNSEYGVIAGVYYSNDLPSSNGVIKNNTITNISWCGIVLSKAVSIMVSRNSISDGRMVGIITEYNSNGIQIIENELYRNIDGIRVRGQNTTVYHNLIIANQLQAFNENINLWDNNYPSGGNYWSDYNGTDMLSGPNQDQPGADGIGDTPYYFDGGQDDYPLMEPWGPPPEPDFTIELTVGWNLISIPLETTYESVEVVLSSISGSWDVVKHYDGQTKTWKTYRVGSTVNTLFTIDRTMGFWLHATEACTLTVSGTVPDRTEIMLYAGWNLVGYTSRMVKTVAEALVGTGYDQVEVFQPESPYIREAEPDYIMKRGEGYWVRVPADIIWVIEDISPIPTNIVVNDILFSNSLPDKGETTQIEARILNFASGAVVDVKFYDGVEGVENLIGSETILVPTLGQAFAQVDWIAAPGGHHTILVTAYPNETWASEVGCFEGDPSDNYLEQNIFVTPNILLVDDDQHPNDLSDGDTVSFMRAALEAANFDYDFVTVGTGDGPGYDYGDYQLRDYDVVIWMTGYEGAPLTPNDLDNLERYLAGNEWGDRDIGGVGGSLWLISQGFWKEATTEPYRSFAMLYLRDPGESWQTGEMFNGSLPSNLYGNELNNVTDYFATAPIKTLERVPGTDDVSYWLHTKINNTATVALGDLGKPNIPNFVYAMTARSDSVPSAITDSRILVQTWDFSRIEDTATQSQYAYKAVMWLSNTTMRFTSDIAISQQDAVPTTVSLANSSATVKINATIRNNGFMEEVNVGALLLMDMVPMPASYTVVPVIGGNGGEWEVSYVWAPDTPGTYEFTWVVDPYDDIAEINELNNQLSPYLAKTTVEVLP
ncbi:MAG: NosD domain-containing protein [Thermoplasmata archaeon]